LGTNGALRRALSVLCWADGAIEIGVEDGGFLALLIGEEVPDLTASEILDEVRRRGVSLEPTDRGTGRLRGPAAEIDALVEIVGWPEDSNDELPGMTAKIGPQASGRADSSSARPRWTSLLARGLPRRAVGVIDLDGDQRNLMDV
jgi:hypothetical protein